MFRHVQKKAKTVVDTTATPSVADPSPLRPSTDVPFGLLEEETELPEEHDSGPAAKSDPFKEEYDRVCASFEFIGTELVGKKNRKFYRCVVCFKYQDIAIKCSYRALIDKFCKKRGGQKRTSEWKTHVDSSRHQQCVQYQQTSQLTSTERVDIYPFKPYLEKEQQKMGKMCAQLMYTVYCDAKRGTLSVRDAEKCVSFLSGECFHQLIDWLIDWFF